MSKTKCHEQIILIPGGININENGGPNHLVNDVKQIWKLWASIRGRSNPIKEAHSGKGIADNGSRGQHLPVSLCEMKSPRS